MNDPHIFLQGLTTELQGKTPRVILKSALSHFKNIAISFSGAEDVVLIDMAVQLGADIKVFCLDTGRLHPETYRYLDVVRTHYAIEMDVLSPEAAEVEGLVREKGLFSFYTDGHSECCGIRKVVPLRRKLGTLDAWITGQRRDQSLTRSDLVEVELDENNAHAGQVLFKFNPLTHWSSAQVWDYIEAYAVPVNELHRKGYISIGCEPCTRSILPNQHEREGRWWWEEGKKECGLHAANLNPAESR